MVIAASNIAVDELGAPEGRSVPPSRQPSTRVPLVDRTYDMLLNQFMSGERAPGERLNIDALSRSLGISATPVREALARLEHTGLIRREPLRGYEVAPLLTPTQVNQLIDARLLLEPALAGLAARRVTSGFLTALRTTIGELERVGEDAADANIVRSTWEADETFHMLVAHRSGNPFLERAYQSLGGQLQRFRLLAETNISHAQAAAHDHRHIYEALRAKDSAETVARMKLHIRQASDRMVQDAIAVTAQTSSARTSPSAVATAAASSQRP